MTRTIFRTACAALLAAPILFAASAGQTQDRDGGFLNNLFSRGEGGQRAAPQGGQQGVPPQDAGTGDASDIAMRMGRLENALREMTGTVERLQFENQQLKTQIQRMQDDNEFRFRELGAKSPSGTRFAAPPASAAPMPAAPASPSAQPGRRSDVFDPLQHPAAPGAPRALGSVSGNTAATTSPPIVEPEVAVGAPGGRAAGAPLDLSTLSGSIAAAPPPVAGAPPQQGARQGTQVATLPPGATPKDEFDLAYGYVLHKDYALAEQSFQTFLKKHQASTLEPEARYWLGETYFQRQRYQDAADSFLIVVRNFEKSGKAPEALLRLGQSLAALNQKELACASFGEVARKYPRAAGSVKRAVEQEQKRAKC